MEKRSFLKKALVLVTGAFAFLVSAGTARFVFFSRERTGNREVAPEILSKLEDGVPLHVPEAGAWLVKSRTEEGMLVLDDRCTHLGCRFAWNRDRKLFECPCHGSEFDVQGKVRRGPASRPVSRLFMRDDGKGKIRLLEEPPRRES